MAHRVVLEVGTKRVFAAALDWPGWTRAGRDEGTAVEHLQDHADRYAAVVAAVGGFDPDDKLVVVERLPGDASTDFGAPGAIAAADHDPVDTADLARLEKILRACWAAFDGAAALAEGLVLTTGPRGGGRDLETIRNHVREAEQAYVRRVGGTAPKEASSAETHEVFLTWLGARAHGEVPKRRPAWRQTVAHPIRCPLRRLARPRPQLGDREPCGVRAAAPITLPVGPP